MQKKIIKKSGMISIELALGLVVSIFVATFAYTFINEYIYKMTENTNLTNLVNISETKTAYSNYYQNYTESRMFIK